MSNLEFSPLPGPYERHLKRRLLNPLFQQTENQISQNDIDHAKKMDEQLLLEFMQRFKNIVKRTTELEPNSESDIILEIKEQLDECYATSFSMPGDHENIRQAVQKLIIAIMNAVRNGAADDPIALKKLDEEMAAREMHNNLHNIKLIADIMLEDSPIGENELTATLLNEKESDLAAALQLFNIQQLEHIYKEAKQLLENLRNDGHELPDAWQRFNQVKDALMTAQQNNGEKQ